MDKMKRVLLMIESSRAYGRGCISGVASYAKNHRHWRVIHMERSLGDNPLAFIKDSKPDGIIARIASQRIVAVISQLNVPVVDLMGACQSHYEGILDTDPDGCAQYAVDHFLSRGFRNMAYCGYPGIWFSDQRCHFFIKRLDKLGYTTLVFEPPASQHRGTNILHRERNGELDEHYVIAWLEGLPKPVAVFACNDIRGRQVIAACEHIGLSVPDDVAVLGVDNDEIICDLSIPPLSSIEPDAKRIGYDGAAMLDRIMSGKPLTENTRMIPPKCIKVRQSTDVLAVEDREMAAAMRFVRDHACDEISVAEIARRLAMGRSTLDRNFRRILGRSVKAEMDRIRADRAKQLLDETEYKIASIASMTGFGTAPLFVTAFKRLSGMTPGEYRRKGSHI